MKASLTALVVLFLLLCAGYNAALPVGGAPDEPAHLEYVRVLAEEGRLPRLDLTKQRNELDKLGYEAHQPPLYYLLAAPAYRLAAVAGAGTQGRARAARAVSTLVGAVGILLIGLLAGLAVGEREGEPEPGSAPPAGKPAHHEADADRLALVKRDRWLVLGAAAFAAFLPMRLSVCASVSNDALAEAAATGALCLALWGMRRGFTARRSAALGAALGAAVLAKASGLLLFPVALAAVVFGSQAAGPGSRKGERPQSHDRAAAGVRLGPALGSLAIVFGTAALLCGWWFARNQALYGDMTLERTFKLKFQDALAAQDAVQLFGYGNLGAYLTGLVLPMSFETFWGAFGYLMDPKCFMGALPGAARELAAMPEALAALLGVATLGTFPRVRPAYPPNSWVYPLLALWTWVAAVGLARLYLRWRAAAGIGVSAAAGAWRFSRAGKPAPRGAANRARKGKTASGGEGSVSRAGQPDLLEPVTPAGDFGTKSSYLLLGLYAVLVLAALLRFNTEFFQAQGRYLFPALGPLALGFAAGWLAWFPGERRQWGAVSLGTALFALANYALWGVLFPKF